MTIDNNLLLAINSLAYKNHAIDSIGIFLSGNIFVALWTGMILGLATLPKWRYLRNNAYLGLASAIVSRGVIVEVLKRVINRPRPYEVVSNLHKLIIDNEQGNSFPSGHAVIYFSFAFAFWGTEFFWPSFILAVLASVDRIFVGVHYPSDIIASAIIAWLTVLLIKRLFKKRLLS